MMNTNEEWLDQFQRELKSEGLKEKTITKHMGHVRLFALTYMEGREALNIGQGAGLLDDFYLWYAHKIMQASMTSMKESMTALKKFYKFLHKLDHISDDTYKAFIGKIKDSKTTWLSAVVGLVDDQKISLMTGLEDLKSMRPWESFSTEEIFCIEVDKIPYFIFFLGHAGQTDGLMVYKGYEGYLRYMALLNGNNLSPQVAPFIKLGYEVCFDGDDPLLHLHIPGREPMAIGGEDEAILTEIVGVLLGHMAVPSRLKTNLDAREDLQVLTVNQSIYRTRSWVKATYAKAYDLDFTFDDLALRRLDKKAETPMVWEIESFFIPRLIEGAYPRLNLVMDVGSGQVLLGEVVDFSDAAYGLSRGLLKIIEEKGKPKTLILPEYPIDTMVESLLDSMHLSWKKESQDLIPVFKEGIFKPDPSLVTGPGLAEDTTSLYDNLWHLTKMDLLKLSDRACFPLKKSLNKAAMIDCVCQALEEPKHLERLLSQMTEMTYILFIANISENELFSHDSIMDAKFLLDLGLMSMTVHEEGLSYSVPDEIKETFKQISELSLEQSIRHQSQLDDFLKACVNLYGAVALADAHEIYRSYWPGDLEAFGDFKAKCLSCSGYYVCTEDALVHEVLINEPANMRVYLGSTKALYKPCKETFMAYSDEEYYEETEKSKKLKAFLYKLSDGDKELAEDLMYEMIDIANDGQINEIFECLNHYGLSFDNDRAVNDFLGTYTAYANSSRSWFNRGHIAESVHNNKSQKVGRNQPCPCGSGKKYKKCCGK